MTRHGSVTRPWSGGHAMFRLGLDEIEELERKTDKAIFVLMAGAVAAIPFIRTAEVREVIRIGLLGGGATPAEVEPSVRFQLESRPLSESVDLAADILMAAVERVQGTNLPGEMNAPGSPPD